MKPISSNLHFYLLSIPMMVLFSISFFTARAQVTENNPMKQTKTFYFNGIPVPQGIMDSLPAKPEDRAVADFYEWLDEHGLHAKFTAWIDSVLQAQSGTVIIGEKFCDVEFKDGLVSIRNIVVNGQTTQIDNKAKDLKQTDMNNLQIIYLKKSNAIYLLGDHGICYIQLSVSGMEVTSKLWSISVPEKLNPEVIVNLTGYMVLFTTQKSLFVSKKYVDYNKGEMPFQIYKHDGSAFFTHPGATYEDAANGIFMATTPTTLFVMIESEIRIIVYDKQFGEGAPFTKPRLDEINGQIKIRDPTMPDQQMLFDPKTRTIGLLDMPSQPNRTIDMK